MAVKDLGGTPLERLKTQYERTRMRCTACGHTDSEGSWMAAMSGALVRYEHQCPSCGAVETRELVLR